MRDRVLITGANGFLGRHIVEAWKHEADITPLLRNGSSDLSINSVICDLSRERPSFKNAAFDTVIHCAAKAHTVPKTKQERDEFFSVNVVGTRNLLGSIETAAEPPKKVIFISSVAVYGRDTGTLLDENEPLNGNTPYAESKIAAEEMIASWSKKNGAEYFSLRLPLIAGADPPGNLGRMLTGIKSGTYVRVRNNVARKSVVLAEDVAGLTLQLSSNSGEYNLTDRVDPGFREIENAVAAALDRRIYLSVPKFLLKSASHLGGILGLELNRDLYEKLTSTLTFSSDLAFEKLGWRPRSSLEFIRAGGLIGAKKNRPS